MISELSDFFEAYALWLAVFSVVSLVVASLLAGWFIAWLPADYFVHEKRHAADGKHWLVRIFLIAVKNAIGLLLIAAGFLMLFTPGQGLLTLLAGLLLTDFPGKYCFERWLVGRKKVMQVLNWLRARSAGFSRAIGP